MERPNLDKNNRAWDGVKEFGESSCSRGMWGGVIKGTQLISLALAYSGKLKKFGA